MVDPELKNNVNRMLNVFENDSGSPETDYSTIYLYKDGNNQRRQVTLGRGFTDDGGNLKKVVDRYMEKGGKFAKDFAPYTNSFGKGILDDDKDFLALLVKATKEDQIMKDSEDQVFDERYWERAIRFVQTNGFSTALSMAVIMDSYLHSGGILAFLRSRFSESVPAKGGDEQNWIKQYVQVRKDWLISKGKPLSNTIYRPNFFQKQIEADNWDFQCPLIANGRKLC